MRTKQNYFLIAASIIFIYLFIMNAYVNDDAYITFRVIDNFLNGFGLRWNIFERVQVFTHPLWMFVNIPLQFISGEPYFTTIIFSGLLSLGAVLLAAGRNKSGLPLTIIAFAILISSRSFIEYSASGLENPLSYFLVALFFYIRFSADTSNKDIWSFLLISLIALNRPDLLLLFLPFLALKIRDNFSIKYFGRIIIAFLPLIIWELFVLIYYGSFFPNTAIAKMGGDTEFSWKISMAFAYFKESLINDPVTLITIFSIVVFSIKALIKNRKSETGLLGAGIALYMLYIFYIGGDFMAGRFFSVPFLMSVLILLNSNIKLPVKNLKYQYALSAGILLITILISNTPPILSGPGYGKGNSPLLTNHINEDGISDERAFFYQYNGLIPVLKSGRGEPDMLWAQMGKASSESEYNVFVIGAVGMFGYYAGPKKKIIDYYALCDPLLSHLAMTITDSSKILMAGHLSRSLPTGYYESILSGRNEIADQEMAKFYDEVRLVASGDIFDTDRMGIILTGGPSVPDNPDYAKEERPLLNSADEENLVKWHLKSGIYFAKLKEYDKAIEHYENIRKIKSDAWSVYPQLITLNFYKGDDKKAEEYFRELVSANRTQANIMDIVYSQLDLLTGKNMFRQALYLTDIMVDVFPETSVPYHMKTEILYKMGQKNEALKNLENIIKLFPSDAPAFENLIAFYIQSGQTGKANNYADKFTAIGGILPANLKAKLGR